MPDAGNGRIVDKLTIGDGCDGVAYDSKKRNIYTSNGEGTLTVIHEKSADKFTVTENIIIKKGARTITTDKATGLLYLPAAEFDLKEKDQRGRSKMIPGTFQVLVIGK